MSAHFQVSHPNVGITAMPDFNYHEMFPLNEDTTEYLSLATDHVGLEKFNGADILVVENDGLTKLAAQAFYDAAHFLRPGHLKQLAGILDDKDASPNDHFVAWDLLKNANIAAGAILIREFITNMNDNLWITWCLIGAFGIKLPITISDDYKAVVLALRLVTKLAVCQTMGQFNVVFESTNQLKLATSSEPGVHADGV